MKTNRTGWQYWVRLMSVAVIALLVAAVGTVVGTSYQHAMGYLHPNREMASGKLLKASGIEFQEIELLTKDNVKISAWYTPP